MEIIDELESVRRGLYGGAIGYIDFNGDMDFCITIRTMIKKADKVYIQAGAGIVADSNPESEYNRVLQLKQGLLRRFWYLEDLSRKKDVQRIRACLRNTLFQEETL